MTPYHDRIKRLNMVYAIDIDKTLTYFPQGEVDKGTLFLFVAAFDQPGMAPPGRHSIKLEAPTKLHSVGIDWGFISRAESLLPAWHKFIATGGLWNRL